MLLRYDPLRDFDRLTEQLLGPARASMPMDAYRRGDDFVVDLDLPGVDPSSIDLTVDRNVLTVSAKRDWAREDGVQVLAAERPQGSFTRQLFLSDNLDADHIDASYVNGVLTLHVPVKEQAKPRKVEIASGSGTKQIEASSTAA